MTTIKTCGGKVKLTCGGLGTGKTYLNVKHADDELKKETYHKIYSNIRDHAVKAEGITLLPEDWRECDDYSLIIIDECQYNEKFSKHFSSRRDAEIVDLTMIRHRHCDIWFISPDPALLNTDVRKLVNEYIYLEANGKKTAKAYCFDKVQLNVSKNIKLKAYDNYSFRVDEQKYHDMYTSTEDGVPSKRTYHINTQLVGFIIGLILILMIIGLLIYFLGKNTKKDVDKLTQNEQVIKQGSGLKNPIDAITKTLNDDECRKAENLDKPECKAYFDRLTRNRESVNPDQMQVKYNPSNPFESSETIQKDLTYEVTAKPVLAGCIDYKNGKIECFTQQGTIIHEMTNSDKLRILQGDRPFNYFAKQNVNQATDTANRAQSSVDYIFNNQDTVDTIRSNNQPSKVMISREKIQANDLSQLNF